MLIVGFTGFVLLAFGVLDLHKDPLQPLQSTQSPTTQPNSYPFIGMAEYEDGSPASFLRVDFYTQNISTQQYVLKAVTYTNNIGLFWASMIFEGQKYVIAIVNQSTLQSNWFAGTMPFQPKWWRPGSYVITNETMAAIAQNLTDAEASEFLTSFQTKRRFTVQKSPDVLNLEISLTQERIFGNIHPRETMHTKSSSHLRFNISLADYQAGTSFGGQITTPITNLGHEAHFYTSMLKFSLEDLNETTLPSPSLEVSGWTRVKEPINGESYAIETPKISGDDDSPYSTPVQLGSLAANHTYRLNVTWVDWQDPQRVYAGGFTSKYVVAEFEGHVFPSMGYSQIRGATFYIVVD